MIEQEIANVREYTELRHFGFGGVAQSVRVEMLELGHPALDLAMQ
jgi:hypothetical protein